MTVGRPRAATGGGLGEHEVLIPIEKDQPMDKRSSVGIAACAAALALFSVAPAFGGENTGNGKPTAAPEHANSICAFSGQNDDPWLEPFGRVQNWGHTMRFFELISRFFNPGDACRGGSNVPEV
jgi:hypothetical protein